MKTAPTLFRTFKFPARPLRALGLRTLRSGAVLGISVLAAALAICATPVPSVGAGQVRNDARDEHVATDASLFSRDPQGSAPDTVARTSDGFFVTYKITSGNAVGLTVYNNGFFGNNFLSRAPSFEYPLGSNIEHLVRGGIWVGGVTTNGDSLVSTGTIDGYKGDPNVTSEFLPLPGLGIEERSILSNSRYFHPQAKSEQDFLTSYADTAEVLVDPNQPPAVRHNPLSIQVNLETLLYSFEPFDAIVIANCKIINVHPTDPIYNLYVGLYSELASGWKDPAKPNWDQGWFKKKALAYYDSLRIVSEHHYALGDGKAPSWAGIQLLGTRPDPVDSMTVSFNWWNWEPDSLRSDAYRYGILSNGQHDPTRTIAAGRDDPVEIVSAGPFPILEAAAAETLTVSFAFVGGDDDRARSGRSAEEDLLYNARWAKTAFDLNFKIPMPPPSPLLEIQPAHESITVRWSGEPERSVDPKSRQRDFEGYSIYIGEERQESRFHRIFQADRIDSVSYNTGLDALRDTLIAPAETVWVASDSVAGGQIIADILPPIWSYKYVIRGLKDGFKYWVSVTSFDQGSVDIGPLESGLAQNRVFAIPGGTASSNGDSKVIVFPNPYRGDAVWDGSLRRDRYLWFANLPARCSIRIYTLAGDLVDTIDFDQATYHATEIRGIYDPTDPRNPERDMPTLSGGMAAWDLVSRKDQGIASGLYLFSVEDKDSGKKQIGKFLIIK